MLGVECQPGMALVTKDWMFHVLPFSGSATINSQPSSSFAWTPAPERRKIDSMPPAAKVAFGLALVWLMVRSMDGDCDAAIVYPPAPDGGRQFAYEDAARDYQTDPRFVRRLLHIEELKIASPQRKYSVG